MNLLIKNRGNNKRVKSVVMKKVENQAVFTILTKFISIILSFVCIVLLMRGIVSLMHKPGVMVARRKFLRPPEKETLKGTRLKSDPILILVTPHSVIIQNSLL